MMSRNGRSSRQQIDKVSEKEQNRMNGQGVKVSGDDEECHFVSNNSYRHIVVFMDNGSIAPISPSSRVLNQHIHYQLSPRCHWDTRRLIYLPIVYVVRTKTIANVAQKSWKNWPTVKLTGEGEEISGQHLLKLSDIWKNLPRSLSFQPSFRTFPPSSNIWYIVLDTQKSLNWLSEYTSVGNWTYCQNWLSKCAVDEI